MPAPLAATAAIAGAAALAASPAIARAQPSPALVDAPAFAATPAAATAYAVTPAPTAPPAAPPEPRDAVRAYLEPGLAAGVATTLYAAVQLDAGYRLGDSSLWLHGRVAHGTFTTIIDRVLSSDLTEARLGLEARGCSDNGIACIVGGVDFAYRHELLSTVDGDEPPHTTDVTFAAAIARVGLDLGITHLRIRPSLELGVRQGGLSNAGFTTGLAVVW